MKIKIKYLIKMVSVKITKSTIKGKKYTAIFYDNDNKKIKTSQFGSAGMSDYTIHRDDQRKQRYLDRHRANENWNDYMSAGALSRWILWEEKNLQDAIRKYKRKFNLS